jgi:tetratricopeptide (TPR) repeat protein
MTFILGGLTACSALAPPQDGLDKATPVGTPTGVPAGSGKAGDPGTAVVKAASKPNSAKVDSDLLYRVLVAELAGRRGQVDVALENYLAAARVSTDPRVAERATRIALFARNNESATEAARRWIALDPNSIEAHQGLAALMIRAGDADAALEQLEAVIDLTEGGPEKGVSVVAALIGKEKNHRVGLEVMSRLVERHKDVAAAHGAQANLAARVGDRNLALSALDEAIRLKADYTEARLLRASVLTNMGRSKEAFSGLSTAVDLYPNNTQLRLGFARLLVQAREFDRAATEFKSLYNSNPDDVDLLYTLGLLAIESRRLEDAKTYLGRLLELKARTDEANYYLGRIADNQRDFRLAIDYYNKVGSGENQLDAQVRIAEMMGKLGRVEEAREHLDRLRALDSDSRNAVRFYLAESEILHDAGDFEAALRILTTALEESPGNADLLYTRALTAEKLDRSDLFESDLRTVLDSEPDNGHALNALGYFLVDRTDRLAEARDYITRAAKLLPDDPAVIDSLGWLHYREGNNAKALELLRRAYDMMPDAEIAAHLGEVLWVTGDRNEASEVWQKALDAAPDDALLKEVIERFKK